MFARDLAGGGVVIDVGSHVFDVLATWFGENCEVLDYQDDNQGGVETEGRARLRFGDVNVTVALSRLRKLANTCVIQGSERTLKVGTGFTTTFEITDREGAVVQSGQVPVLPPAAGEWTELFAGQLRMFADAVATGAPSLADATAGVATARVTAACYGHPGRPKGVPSWAAFDLPDGAASLEGLRVGVTGATGFIGGRLVDALVTASRAQVVGAVRDFRRLVRLSPLDQDRLTFARLDLDDPRALLDSPVDVFVHCAHGNRGTVEERWRTSVEGTRNALRMAEAAGARRFVHISTVSVYDTSTVESLTESGSAFEPDADDREYAAQKLAAERIALTEARGMDVVVLQPTVVYGPQSGGWTVRPLTRMPADSAILPTGDAGVCNAVYVDDVVSAIILAIATPEAAGRRFLISGDRPISWGRFYDAYRDMCDGALAEAADGTLPEWERRLYASPSAVRIELARKVLGYRPRYSFDRGIAITRDWARWAGLAR
jgi:nucleoside-diphosphate-sugar epimerase